MVKSLHSYLTCIPMTVGLLYPLRAYALNDTSLSKRLLQPQYNLMFAFEMVLGYCNLSDGLHLFQQVTSAVLSVSYHVRHHAVYKGPMRSIIPNHLRPSPQAFPSTVSILPCRSHAAALKAVGKQNSFVLFGACVSECTSSCFTFFSSNT